ncbi:MAG: ABC transporter permease [Holophaga sp.]|jgi:phospholipid/cholesterol/gamma-HCH transport system permease protein
MLQSLLERIGASILEFSTQAGDFVTISGHGFVCIFKRPFDARNFLRQLVAVGVNSIPVVVLTSLAVSMVFAVQLSYGFRQFQAEGLAAQVEGVAVVRELAPVITGLMMAGRVGSAMAAELGTMQVTEQIDALECLATDPVHFLFVPRLLAAAAMLPLLTGFAIYVGYLGGYTLLVGVQGQSAWVYGQDFYKLLSGRDLVIALTKALVFGLIIALVGCWRGFRTRGGAEGVGNAPTSSVVTSSLWILIADFFLTKLLLV